MSNKIKEILNKIVKFVSSKTFMLVLSLIGLFLLSTGITLAVFSIIKKPSSSTVTPGGVEKTRTKINIDMPKTEECPLNGAKFTKAEKDIWESRRPITAVIENHADSRPPSGLSKADIVYEIVAEGGITIFLGVFYCGVSV